jgi:hypothetical protein
LRQLALLRLRKVQHASPAKFEQHINHLYSPENIHETAKKLANLRSAYPLPLVLKVGENVDNTHDPHVKTFAYKGHMHLGLHILCPNSSLR